MSTIHKQVEARSEEELNSKIRDYLSEYPPKKYNTFFHTPVKHPNGTWTAMGQRFK